MPSYTIQEIKNGFLLVPGHAPDEAMFFDSASKVVTALKKLLTQSSA